MFYFSVFVPVCFIKFAEWKCTFLSRYPQVSRPFQTKHREKRLLRLSAPLSGRWCLVGYLHQLFTGNNHIRKIFRYFSQCLLQEGVSSVYKSDHKEWNKEQGPTTARKQAQEFSGLLESRVPLTCGWLFCRVPDLLGGVWQEWVPPGQDSVQQHPGVQDHRTLLPHHLHHRGGCRDRPGQRLGHLLHHLLWSAPRLVNLQETKQNALVLRVSVFQRSQVTSVQR